MATIHLMYGFIGFGKTTIAKKIAKEHEGVRFTVDDFNTKVFGRNPVNDGFGEYLPCIKEHVWDMTADTVANGIDVVVDFGGVSSKQGRTEAWQRAKAITPDVVLHVIKCDMEVAKKRTIARTATKENGIDVTETDFEEALKRFEPMQADEARNYKIVYHGNDERIKSVISS